MELPLDPSGLNSLMNQYAPLRKRKARFLFAGSALVLASVFTVLSQWLFGTPAAVLFFLGVIACTGMLGLAAGLVAAAGSALAIDLFFVPPIFEITPVGVTLRLAAILAALAGGTHLVERRISAGIRSQQRPPLGMHGSVDGIENGELYGWALDADSPFVPVPITLLINRHPVANVAAVYHRPDVAQTMDCSWRHGFYVDLAPYFPAQRTAWVDVQLPGGRSVANSPRLLTIGPISPRTKKPTVIFMHVPKTAGTAFREAIAANFAQSEIAYQYPGPPGFLTTDLRELPLEQRRAFRMVIGHLQFGVHETLPQNSDYITIVREPAARVLSQYAYLQQEQPELVQDQNGRVTSLPELLETRLTVDFDNMMVRCFAGTDEREFPPGSLTQEIFERACENMRRHFTFIGHQEQSAEAYEWLRRYYGWHAAPELSIVNRGRLRPQVDESVAVLIAIRACNHWDYLLYEEILKVFPLTGSARASHSWRSAEAGSS